MYLITMESLISILTLVVLAVTAYFIYETMGSQKHEANFQNHLSEINELKIR